MHVVLSARAYVLLDVEHGQSAKVVRALRGWPGVIMADVIEGPSDVIMVVEAHGRRRLAELTVKALSSIEHMTGDLKVLPVPANDTDKSRNRMTTNCSTGERRQQMEQRGKQVYKKKKV